MRITLDTNLVDHARVLDVARALEWDVCIVSVTNREVEGSSFGAAASAHTVVPEIGVWGESRWGEGTWGDDATADSFEITLRVIGGGSFPAKGQREILTAGQHRQLRDAIIFSSHVRDQREIFVTDDRKGFVEGTRRETLQNQFGTRIMTSVEFVQAFGTGLDTVRDLQRSNS